MEFATILTFIITTGILLACAAVLFCLIKWGNVRCVGVTPVPLFTFVAILFTSGLDVGLIMFPLTEFPVYADLETSPEYGFTNPLAMEFGFWAFLIWGFYFLTTFYFCVIEPRVKFFEIHAVKMINNVVIIGTCAFTAYLFLVNLPWYAPALGDGETVNGWFYLIVILAIAAAVFSSTDIKYVRILSLTSVGMFAALILLMGINGGFGPSAMFESVGLLGGYFANIHKFILPFNDYHEFYLFWWFAWSIMIGQFTARFVGGLKTWQLFAALLVIPSIPLAIWFSVLHHYWITETEVTGLFNFAMIVVGTTFVINSLDSLTRLYSDNLGLTVARFGRLKYIGVHISLLTLLTLLFSLDLIQIQWIGSIVVGIYLSCLGYIIYAHRTTVMSIVSSPEEQTLDFTKIEQSK